MMEALSISETLISFYQTAWCIFSFIKSSVSVICFGGMEGRVVGWQLTLLPAGRQIVFTVVLQQVRVDGSTVIA
jgi:hypothetical protein